MFAIGAVLLRFLRSRYALFGLRASLAAFVVAVPAYLEDSVTFYEAYRGVWSTVVIVISLGPTTGASVNALLSQSAGTILGGLVAMAVWYVVDEKTAAVIVFSFVVTIFRMNVIGTETNRRSLLFASRSPKRYSTRRLC